ncbi:hypothetical protein [Nonomuraea sp. H19]
MVETWKVDARHVASGKERALPQRQQEAKRRVHEQKDRNRQLGGK